MMAHTRAMRTVSLPAVLMLGSAGLENGLHLLRHSLPQHRRKENRYEPDEKRFVTGIPHGREW